MHRKRARPLSQTCKSLRSVFLPFICQRFACNYQDDHEKSQAQGGSCEEGRNWFANRQTQRLSQFGIHRWFCTFTGKQLHSVASIRIYAMNVRQTRRECHNAEFLLRHRNSLGVWRFSPIFTLSKSSESRRRRERPTMCPKV